MIRDRPARGARRALPLALAGLALFAAPRAEAYVRYKTKSGIPFFWPQTCVPIALYPASMTDINGNMEMTTDQIVGAATAAAAAWSAGANSCTFLQLNVTASTDPTPTAKLDYRNVIVFRTKSWCAPSDKPPACSYPQEALAITSVFDNKANGQIIDADIEVNSHGFVWADLDTNPSPHNQDLQNALTHEMGHLIGLDHTCWISDPDHPEILGPLDNNGNPVPDCNSAPADVQATTMFASAIPGDVAKRTLAPDDIQGLCDSYPPAKDPMKCPAKDEPPPGRGCALAPSGPGGAVAAFVALVALGLAARRRRGGRA